MGGFAQDHKAKKKPVSGCLGSKFAGFQDARGGMGNQRLMGAEFQFCKMKRVVGMDGGDGCTVGMSLMSLNCTLKNGYNGKFYVTCILP